MRVWHFTGLPHLRKIVRAGVLGVTESISGRRSQTGRRSVVFAESTNASCASRLTFLRRSFVEFIPWAQQLGIHPHWLATSFKL